MMTPLPFAFVTEASTKALDAGAGADEALQRGGQHSPVHRASGLISGPGAPSPFTRHGCQGLGVTPST